jgi:hypothetical protein
VLLRPSTGEVFFFEALPADDQPATSTRLATVAGAREIVTEQTTEACPPLAVVDHEGATHAIGAR